MSIPRRDRLRRHGLCGILDNYLYAIKADGTLKWKYLIEGGVYFLAAIGADGTGVCGV